MSSASTDSSNCFTCLQDGDILIVTFHRPQLTDEDNLEQMGEELFRFVEKDQHRRIVLNLAMVTFVTSSVLGKWISLHRKIARNSGAMVLCDLQPNVREILDASRLLTYFNSADTIDDACRMLNAPDSGAAGTQ
jgi:anti-sigma B factor antagonist